LLSTSSTPYGEPSESLTEDRYQRLAKFAIELTISATRSAECGRRDSALADIRRLEDEIIIGLAGHAAQRRVAAGEMNRSPDDDMKASILCDGILQIRAMMMTNGAVHLRASKPALLAWLDAEALLERGTLSGKEADQIIFHAEQLRCIEESNKRIADWRAIVEAQKECE
jgi:hypothetical protein